MEGQSGLTPDRPSDKGDQQSEGRARNLAAELASARFLEAGMDFDRANAARMYDYFLGGAHNFAVDREFGDRVAVAMPGVREWARGNRAFLMRLVRFCVEQGVRQFLDLGSGIPTVNHVHETARALAPQTRVAYVDFEPVAVAHSEEILASVEGVTITRADAAEPAAVLAAIGEFLDFTQPVAVLAVAIMHFVPDAANPAEILDAYRRALVPGSYLAVTNVSADYDDPAFREELVQATEVYRDSATPAYMRDRPTIRALLGDLTLVEPGLVDINQWRNDDPDAPPLGHYAAVARIP